MINCLSSFQIYSMPVFDSFVRSCVPVVEAFASNAVREKPSSSNLLITKEECLVLYEDMVLGRAFEDMCAQMYYRGKMFGFIRLYNGQEAVSTGFIKLLKQENSMVSTYMDHVHVLGDERVVWEDHWLLQRPGSRKNDP